MLCALGCEFQMPTFTRTYSLLGDGLPLFSLSPMAAGLADAASRTDQFRRALKDPGCCSRQKEL